MTLLPVSFLNVFPICVCVVSPYMLYDLCMLCVFGRERVGSMHLIYLSLAITPYLARSHALSSRRPWHQQARMRIAARAERVCGTEESGWSQTLC